MSGYDIIYVLGSFFMGYVVYKFLHLFYSDCRVNPRIERLLYLIHPFILSIIYFVLPSPFLFFLGNIITIFITTCIYEGRLPKAIMVTLLCYALFMIIESLVGVTLLNLLPKERSFFPLEADTTVILCILRIVIYAFVRLLESPLNIRNRKDISMPVSYWSSLFLIPTSTIAIGIIILESPGLTPLKTMISMSCMLLINILTFYIYDKIMELMEEKLTFSLLHEQNRFYDSQVKMMKNSLEEVRILRHDMNNKLTPIYHLVKMGNTLEALEQLTELTKINNSGREYSKSGNTTVDALINYKLQHIDTTSIDLTTNVALPCKLNIPDFDMAVILGNLLDNALEATTLADTPMLSINIKYAKGCLIILITNTYDGTLFTLEKKLITRKKDKINHGLGLKSVEKTLEKYDGLLNTTQDGELFTAEVLLYI